jgi:hypothetical protein
MTWHLHGFFILLSNLKLYLSIFWKTKYNKIKRNLKRELIEEDNTQRRKKTVAEASKDT